MVAPALIGMGVGAGIGMLRQNEARQQEAADRRIAAAKAAYAPWTGMAPGRVQRASIWDNVGGGMIAGGMMGDMVQGGGEPDAASDYGDGGFYAAQNPGDAYGMQQSMRMRPQIQDGSAYDSVPQQSMRMREPQFQAIPVAQGGNPGGAAPMSAPQQQVNPSLSWLQQQQQMYAANSRFPNQHNMRGDY